jgi:hypothetical protein
MSREIIEFDSDEAARYVTNLSGWVSRDGIFFGKEERVARYSGCTHRHCEKCGDLVPKHWLKCAKCREEADRQRWEAMPVTDWTPLVCIYRDDTYFHDEDGFLDWCEDRDIDPSTVMLVACEPVFASEFDAEDYYSGDLPEDGELPDEIAVAVHHLNEAIRECKTPLCWRPTDKRVRIPGVSR